MTEQALLPAPAESFEDNGKPENRRVLLIGAVAGALALLVAAYFLFFTGGSSDQALGQGPLPLPKAKAAAPKAPAASKPVAKAVPATFAGVHATDPFKPLYDPPPAPAATAAPGSVPPGAPGAAPGAAPVQIVTLNAVGTKSVLVDVNGTSYSPKVGTSFATFFKLERLQGPNCATFLYGDESFDLCKGSTTTKQ